MSGLLWLMFEMMGLLLLAAVVFFVMGWRWQGQRARTQAAVLEGRLEVETALARAAEDERKALLERPLVDERMVSELKQAEQRQRTLEREMWRLREEKTAAEQALEVWKGQAAAKQALAVETAVHQESLGEADDLTLIRGLGAVLSRKLAEAGVKRYRQLAELTPEQVVELDRRLSLRGRIRRDEWQQQARALEEARQGRQVRV
jgi:predicted flap endonuclease-1-like 5' DNA nuclease